VGHLTLGARFRRADVGVVYGCWCEWSSGTVEEMLFQVGGAEEFQVAACLGVPRAEREESPTPGR